jgi:hypothetical protein
VIEIQACIENIAAAYSPWLPLAQNLSGIDRLSSKQPLLLMSELGQNAKYSYRVDVFRFASEPGPKSDITALPKCANIGSVLSLDGIDLPDAARQFCRNFKASDFAFQVAYGCPETIP